MNETSVVGWPYDSLPPPDDRERLQEDIQEAFDRVLDDAVSYGHLRNHEGLASAADIKLLKWALGVK